MSLKFTATALNDTTYTEIDLGGFLPGSVVQVSCSDGTIVMTLADDSDGTNAFVLALKDIIELPVPRVGGKSFYAKSASGTPNCQVVGLAVN
jgi:hypothetical protein